MEKTYETEKPDMEGNLFHKSELLKNVLTAVWVLFSVGFVLFMMKTGRVNFETNDDIIMAQITSGVFGKYSPYNVFSNIVLGLILMGFSEIMPGFNWPSLFDLGFIAVSYAMLGVICIRSAKKNILLSVLAPLVFVFATFRTMILGINFS